VMELSDVEANSDGIGTHDVPRLGNGRSPILLGWDRPNLGWAFFFPTTNTWVGPNLSVGRPHLSTLLGQPLRFAPSLWR
jgi:hypothetical protein